MKRQTADYFFSKGNELYAASKLDKALTAYGKALEFNPQHIKALNNRGCVYDDKGLFDLAIADLSSALRIDPTCADALYNRGHIYGYKGLWELAIQDFTEAIGQLKEDDGPGMNHNLAKAFNNRGNIYYKKQLWDLAVQDYTEATRIDPGAADAFNNRGRAYLKKGLLNPALEDFTKVIAVKFPGEDPRRLIMMVTQDERQRGLDFARGLLLEGFYVDIQGDSHNPVIIKPYWRSNRAVLFFDKLHTGKTIHRHLARSGGSYRLCFDTDFDAVLKRCVAIHGEAVLTPDFQNYFKELKNSGGPVCPVSFSLYRDGKLAAGDIGVQIGKVYTSYSGYHNEPSAGTVQIILTARYLEEKGFAFWDFGYSDEFSYKTRLSAQVLSHEEYKTIFNSASEAPGRAPSCRSHGCGFRNRGQMR